MWYQQELISKEKNANGCLSELVEFLEFLNNLNPSKKTHYQDLDIWSDEVYNFIRAKLEKHGFIQAAPLKGVEQPPKAKLWWLVYGLVGAVIHSPNLKTEVAHHHSSAFEQNEALKTDLKEIIIFFLNKI